MSAALATQADHGDFWEFASCGRCQMPFLSPAGPTVPFWLTECGHLICNNHLSANQSCSICGAPGIQLIPLQREMDAPMSLWFQSVPTSLDNIAHAAKFQQDTMASQIRYYRARHQQQRAFIEKLKHEIGELKKLNDRLQGENDHFRQHFGPNEFPNGGLEGKLEGHDTLNSNGKRSRTGASPYNHPETFATTSSPRSIATPLGPNRLTLPHNLPTPNLSSNQVRSDNVYETSNKTEPESAVIATQNRPASAFVEKYAYVPPSTPQFHRPQLAHTQAPLQMFKRTRPNPEQDQPQQVPPNQAHRSMPPPPTPARFKAVQTSSTNPSNQSTFQGSGPSRQQSQKPANASSSSRQNHSYQAGQDNAFTSATSRNSNRFHPPTNRFMPPTPIVQPSEAQTGNGPQRFVSASSRAPSRARQDEGQTRIPFITRDQRHDSYI